MRGFTLIISLAYSFSLGLAQEKPPKPLVRVEFHWGEDKIIKGVTDTIGVDLSCTNHKVYLHRKPILEPVDMRSAQMRLANAVAVERYFLEVTLTPDAAKRLANSSKANLGKPLVVIVDGTIAAAMVVQTELSDFVPITGLFTKADAERLVKAINKK